MKQEIGVITLTYGKRKVDNIAGWMHLKKMYRTLDTRRILDAKDREVGCLMSICGHPLIVKFLSWLTDIRSKTAEPWNIVTDKNGKIHEIT